VGVTPPDTIALDRYRAVFEGALGTPFFAGNAVDILVNGREIFPAMLEAIDQAQSTVDFLTFVYWKGEIAERFCEALSEAARRGARVRVLLDGVGARPMDHALIERMRGAGCAVRWFRPVSRLAFWKVAHRTHRKVLVCDENVAFTGGVGIAEEWEGDARGPAEWRETQVRLRGPAIQGLQAAFLENWADVEPLDLPMPEQATPFEPAGDTLVQVVRSSASVGWSDLATLARTLLTVAHRSIFISTPYFVPDEPTVTLLCEVARRPVDIDIVLPGPHTDERVVQIAGQDVYAQLLDSGVRIWEYQPTIIHQKIISVDGAVVAIGSGNLNQRSLSQDDEVQLVVLDIQFASRIDAMLRRDLEQSRRVELGDWEERGLVQRSLETLTKPFKSQM